MTNCSESELPSLLMDTSSSSVKGLAGGLLFPIMRLTTWEPSIQDAAFVCSTLPLRDTSKLAIMLVMLDVRLSLVLSGELSRMVGKDCTVALLTPKFGLADGDGCGADNDSPSAISRNTVSYAKR